MRRFFLGLAMIAALGLVPCRARGNDRQIAQKIVESLQEHKENGDLRGINIDLDVENGAVYLQGHVASEEQEELALEVARHVEGVRKVYNELDIVERDDEEGIESSAGSRSRPTSILSGKSKGASVSSRVVVADASSEAPITQAAPDSQEIVNRIYARLKEEKDNGRLKGFSLDLEVDEGIATLKGKVSSAEQQKRVLDIVRRVPGVTQVVNGIVIASVAKSSDDLGQEVIQRLKAKKDSGELKSFHLDVEVEEGIVWLSGFVADEEQRQLVLETTRYIPGVVKVVNDLSIGAPNANSKHNGTRVTAVSDRGQVRRAPTPPPDDEEYATDYEAPRPLPLDGPIGSSVAHRTTRQLPAFADQPSVPAPSLNSPIGIGGTTQAGAIQANGARQQVQYVWVPASQPGMGTNPQAPLAFAPARSANYQEIGGVAAGSDPVPLNPGMPGVGIAPARFDHPQMPNYAWPSYAPYPNYGAVTYPKQYSPMAWPYIGPFYPYPQVPLGWRKVTLEWDDGWWQLDFKSRH